MPPGGGRLKGRILFLYQSASPFILQDRDLLANRWQVREYPWPEVRHPGRALARWMLRHRGEFDLVFCWFGDSHAYVATRVARMLVMPSIVVVGGYDVSDIPGYGVLATPKGLRRGRRTYERATRILPVSESLRNEIVRRFPRAQDRVRVLPTGVDSDRFRPDGPRAREVLCVAPVSRWERALVKGLDRIDPVARSYPDVPFRIVGVAPEVASRLEVPENVSVSGPVPQEVLIPAYQKASVYLQPSRSEGLPNSVMEAMACGCVPVVTAVGGMPDLVAEAGFVTREDIIEIGAAVGRAFDAPELGDLARKRVLAQYSLSRRVEGLDKVVEELLSEASG